MRAPIVAAAGIIAGLACGCGGKVLAGAQQATADGGVQVEAGPIFCAGETCAPGTICKLETDNADATPCCGTCMDFDAALPAPGTWTCTQAEEYCRMGCLAAEWPYVYCMIE